MNSRDDSASVRELPCKLLVVLNPHAAAGRSESHHVRLRRLVTAAGGRIAAPASFDELATVAAEAALGADDVLAIVGGDGTISATLGAFSQAAPSVPRLALLRGGTMNTIARGLGVPSRDPEWLLRALLDELQGQSFSTMERSSLQIAEVGRGQQSDRHGFLFGIGVMASFLDAYNALPRPGLWGAAGLLARASFGALIGRDAREPVIRPVEARIVVDDEPRPSASYQLLAAATVPQVGLGFAPFHRAQGCEQRMHVLGFTASVQQLALSLPALRRGAPLPPERGMDQLAQRIDIHSGETPLRYSLDGEVYAATGALTVTAGPLRRIWKPQR